MQKTGPQSTMYDEGRCYEQDAEVQDRAWPQGQNMPCAPTDHPVPNLTEGWGMKPPGGAEYTARGEGRSPQKMLNTQPEVRA